MQSERWVRVVHDANLDEIPSNKNLIQSDHVFAAISQTAKTNKNNEEKTNEDEISLYLIISIVIRRFHHRCRRR